jgi:hypothetical protein
MADGVAPPLQQPKFNEAKASATQEGASFFAPLNYEDFAAGRDEEFDACPENYHRTRASSSRG